MFKSSFAKTTVTQKSDFKSFSLKISSPKPKSNVKYIFKKNRFTRSGRTHPPHPLTKVVGAGVVGDNLRPGAVYWCNLFCAAFISLGELASFKFNHPVGSCFYFKHYSVFWLWYSKFNSNLVFFVWILKFTVRFLNWNCSLRP